MVFPNSTNHYGTMFGGKVLELMDRAAFLSASRFAQQAMVTASTERIDFHQPIKHGQMVEATARVIHSGHTSVTVHVSLFAEDPVAGLRVHATEGYFHMVAIGPEGRPVPVPSYVPETPEERTDWDLAERMKVARRSRANG